MIIRSMSMQRKPKITPIELPESGTVDRDIARDMKHIEEFYRAVGVPRLYLESTPSNRSSVVGMDGVFRKSVDGMFSNLMDELSGLTEIQLAIRAYQQLREFKRSQKHRPANQPTFKLATYVRKQIYSYLNLCVKHYGYRSRELEWSIGSHPNIFRECSLGVFADPNPRDVHRTGTVYLRIRMHGSHRGYEDRIVFLTLNPATCGAIGTLTKNGVSK